MQESRYKCPQTILVITDFQGLPHYHRYHVNHQPINVYINEFLNCSREHAIQIMPLSICCYSYGAKAWGFSILTPSQA